MRVDRGIRFEYAMCGRVSFESEKKKLRIQKYPDTCGRRLSKLLSAVFLYTVKITDVHCVLSVYNDENNNKNLDTEQPSSLKAI